MQLPYKIQSMLYIPKPKVQYGKNKHQSVSRDNAKLSPLVQTFSPQDKSGRFT